MISCLRVRRSLMKNKAAPKGKDLETNKVVAYIEETKELEESRARNIDDLVMYDDLMQGILSSVKKDLAAGLTGVEIMNKYAAIAAARTVSIAATEADSGKALQASKDIMDRAYGKAKETKDVTHRLDKVEEKQIDALLISELESLELDGDDGENDKS